MAETETVEDVGTNALSPEPAPVVENLQPEPVAEIAQTETVELAADPAPEPAKEHGNKGKTPWYMDRINEETNKRRQIEEQLTQERREKQEAKALLERMQGGDKDQPKSRTEEPDIDALVDARAEQKLFNQDCNTVAEAGARDIPDFNEKLGILRSIGVVNDEFLKDIFAVDKADAHKILDRLAREPEKANLMVRMDSRRRIAELTRMNLMTETKPAPVPVVRAGISKVPPPKPVVDAVSDDLGEMDLRNDKLDSATWSRLFDKKYFGKATA
jgi:hypothetical protein